MNTAMSEQTDPMLAMRIERMEKFDRQPPEIRALVRDFGWTVVSAYLAAGIKKAGVIRHLIEITHAGSYEIQARYKETMTTSPAGDRLAKAMSDIGLSGSAHALAKRIRFRGGVLMPMQPTSQMVQASIDELHKPRNRDRVVPREEKHRLRLIAAIAVAADMEMPPLDEPA